MFDFSCFKSNESPQLLPENAMAMEPLGKMAGLGASLTSSLSSLITIILSTIVGQFYHFTVTPLACGFVIFSTLALVMLKYGHRHRKK